MLGIFYICYVSALVYIIITPKYFLRHISELFVDKVCNLDLVALFLKTKSCKCKLRLSAIAVAMTLDISNWTKQLHKSL